MRVIGKSKKTFIPPKPADKVYCGVCKFYLQGRTETEHWCKHPSVTSIYDSPIEQRAVYGSCIQLNKNNDCSLFGKRKC